MDSPVMGTPWNPYRAFTSRTLVLVSQVASACPREELDSLANSAVRLQTQRVRDESVFVLLDLPNHLGLCFGRTIVVNDTQTTVKSENNGHPVLCDGVHGRGEERGVEGNVPRDFRLQADDGGWEVDVTG